MANNNNNNARDTQRHLLVALATVLMATWGAIAWAVGQRLASVSPSLEDPLNVILAVGVIGGAAGASVAALALAVAWFPSRWLATYATVVLDTRFRRLIAAVYATPLLAYIACVVFASGLAPASSAWPALAALMAAAPSVVSASFHGWLLAPAALSRVSGHRVGAQSPASM